jgi:hypothetical protein
LISSYEEVLKTKAPDEFGAFFFECLYERKFGLKYVCRNDICALTREVSEVSGVPGVEGMTENVMPQLWFLGKRIRQEYLQKSYEAVGTTARFVADDIIFC